MRIYYYYYHPVFDERISYTIVGVKLLYTYIKYVLLYFIIMNVQCTCQLLLPREFVHISDLFGRDVRAYD